MVGVAVVGVANNIMIRFFNSSYISMCLNYPYSKGSQSEAFQIIEGLPYLYQLYQNSFFFLYQYSYVLSRFIYLFPRNGIRMVSMCRSGVYPPAVCP